MPAAAQAVVSPPKGMKVKNTFIDVDEASDDEVGFTQRRGLVTMPAMPEKASADEDAVDAVEQPTPDHPVLLGALQRADLPDQKVVIKNTFIEEPDASPVSPGFGRRVTCPVVWPSMEVAERLLGFGMQAGKEPSEEESPGRRPSGGGSSTTPCEAGASSDEDDAPNTNRHRWSIQTGDMVPQSGEDSDSDTPRGPRRSGAFDTQNLRECLLRGSMPELEAGSARQPETPTRVPVSLFAATATSSPLPPSPSASCPQAYRSPGHAATQPGVLLSLSSAVDAGPLSPPLQPMAPPSPGAIPTTGVPVSISLAVGDAGTSGSPMRAGAAVYCPGSPAQGQGYGGSPGGASWASVSPYGYPCAVQMPWSSPWPWCAMPVEQVQQQGQAQQPCGAQPVGASPEWAERAERQEAWVPQQAPRQSMPAAAAAADEAVGSPLQPGATADASTAPSTRNGRRLRLWAHIYLHMQVPGFDLVPRLIGRGGCNMRKIAESTGAKIRIRGRGSGHLEIDGTKEAPTPLMVAVTTDKLDETGFRKAIELVIKELRCTEQRYMSFCQKQNIQHEGPCYSIGLLPEEARKCLGAICDGIPNAKRSEA